MKKINTLGVTVTVEVRTSAGAFVSQRELDGLLVDLAVDRNAFVAAEASSAIANTFADIERAERGDADSVVSSPPVVPAMTEDSLLEAMENEHDQE